jgi:hypothetical protein
MKRKTIKVIIVCMFMSIVLSSGALGTALPPEVMSSLKEVKILKVTKDNVDVIWDLRPNQHPDRADIVDLRLNYRDISTELAIVLQEWVSSGKGVILYKSNVHRFFPEIELSGGIRDRSRVAKAIEGNHLVATGVKEVEFRTSYYYLITGELQSSYIPILETEQGEVTGIASCCGRGGVVVLLNSGNWKDAPWGRAGYDNQRFEINVHQWLAGAPVPGSSGRNVSSGPCFRLENCLTPEIVKKMKLLAVQKNMEIPQLIREIFTEYLSKQSDL